MVPRHTTNAKKTFTQCILAALSSIAILRAYACANDSHGNHVNDERALTTPLRPGEGNFRGSLFLPSADCERLSSVNTVLLPLIIIQARKK